MLTLSNKDGVFHIAGQCWEKAKKRRLMVESFPHGHKIAQFLQAMIGTSLECSQIITACGEKIT